MAEYIYSKVQPAKLLHIINRFNEIKPRREDIVPRDQFLQMATIKMEEFQTFRPHRHVWGHFDDVRICQEAWVVLTGKVQVILYDLDDSILRDDIVLYPLDNSITIEAGHNYKALCPDTTVLEFKIGPYRGQALDKEFINV